MQKTTMQKTTMRKSIVQGSARREAVHGTAVFGRTAVAGILGVLGILGLAVASLATTGPARAETWCLRDTSGGKPVCVFPSARHCVAGAGPFGGICERQSAAERVAPPRREGRKSARKSTRSPG